MVAVVELFALNAVFVVVPALRIPSSQGRSQGKE